MKQLNHITYNEKKERPGWRYLFLAGLLLGAFMVLLNREIFTQDTYFFGEDVLKRFGYSSIYKEPFFYYVLKKRVSLFGFMVISSVTIFGCFCLSAFCVWFGTSISVIIVTLFLKYGLKGLLLCVGLFFPQNLIYIPCYILVGNCLYEICKRRNNPGGGYRDYEDARSFYLKRIGVVMAVFIIFLVGCFLESYVNPMFLKTILKNF